MTKQLEQACAKIEGNVPNKAIELQQQRAAALDLLAALKDACASLELQAATARAYAKAGQNERANIGLAEELERNCSVYRAAIAKAEQTK